MDALKKENAELKRGFRLLVSQNECLICFGTPKFCKECYQFIYVCCYEADITSDKKWNDCMYCGGFVCYGCSSRKECEECTSWWCDKCEPDACTVCDKTIPCCECADRCEDCEDAFHSECIEGAYCSKCEQLEE